MKSFRSETLLRACRLAPSESEPLLHYSSQDASLAVLEAAGDGGSLPHQAACVVFG